MQNTFFWGGPRGTRSGHSRVTSSAPRDPQNPHTSCTPGTPALFRALRTLRALRALRRLRALRASPLAPVHSRYSADPRRAPRTPRGSMASRVVSWHFTHSTCSGALHDTPRHSTALYGTPLTPWHSANPERSTHSPALSSHPRTPRTPRHSAAIRGTPRHSAALRGTPRTPRCSAVLRVLRGTLR